MRITFIHSDWHAFYNGKSTNRNYYNFLVRALSEHPDVEYTKIAVSEEFDATSLVADRKKPDAVVLSSIRNYEMPKITGLKSLNVPVLSMIGDAHDSTRYGTGEENYDDYGVDCLFSLIPTQYFYDWYPAHMNYKMIFFGVESSRYTKPKPYDQRIKDKILLSGIIDEVDHLVRRMPYLKWLPRRMRRSMRKYLTWVRMLRESHVSTYRKIRYPLQIPYYFYKLRTDCKLLPCVDDQTLYIRNLPYEQLLYNYCGAIAATTTFPTVKYWEIAAAGCLAFMEITKRNYGDCTGFRDGVNCVAINEDNYREKFERFLDDPDSYAGIAACGRDYALENFSNDVAADRLVKLIRELC